MLPPSSVIEKVDMQYGDKLTGKVMYISLAHHLKDCAVKWQEKFE